MPALTVGRVEACRKSRARWVGREFLERGAAASPLIAVVVNFRSGLSTRRLQPVDSVAEPDAGSCVESRTVRNVVTASRPEADLNPIALTCENWVNLNLLEACPITYPQVST